VARVITGPLVKAITLRGQEGTIVLGYRTAAVLTGWTISGSATAWTLAGTLTRVDRFCLAQRPLRFTAPKKGGFWCWPIDTVKLGTSSVRATLGKPEQ